MGLEHTISTVSSSSSGPCAFFPFQFIIPTVQIFGSWKSLGSSLEFWTFSPEGCPYLQHMCTFQGVHEPLWSDLETHAIRICSQTFKNSLLPTKYVLKTCWLSFKTPHSIYTTYSSKSSSQNSFIKLTCTEHFISQKTLTLSILCICICFCTYAKIQILKYKYII